jgi:hypothetical protein
MGPRRRRSSNWRAAPAVGHSSRETKLGPHASSGREGPVRILANEGDGTDELPENVGFQRHSRAQLSADSNVFIERVWRSVKYEEVYLKAYESVSHARRSIADYMNLYNQKRPHSSLEDQTPDEAYFATLPAIKSAA